MQIQLIFNADELPKGITPEQIIEAAKTLKDAAPEQNLSAQLVKFINKCGEELTRILDDLDGMDKAKALRDMAADLEGFKP